MPNFPTPSSQSPSEVSDEMDRRSTLNHMITVLTHETLVKPDQHQAARDRLLLKAVSQPVLPPLSPPQRMMTRVWHRFCKVANVVSATLEDRPAYDRVRIPMGMMHHYNFDRYYTYRLINVPV